MDAAFAAINTAEQELSWFVASNDLARIRAAAPDTLVPVAPPTMACLVFAQELWQRTHGSYDVCAGPLIRAWGFGPGKTNRVPDAAELAAARARSGMEKLVLLPQQGAVSTCVAGVEVDLSSMAAGVAVDRAAEQLLRHGCRNFLVNGGGEIRVSSDGSKTWQLGIQVPEEHASDGAYLRDRIIAMKNGAVSTSGSYRNYHERGSNSLMHIISPRDGAPLRTETISVTTWAPDGTSADAWSTALFTLPAAEAIALTEQTTNLECLIILRPAPGTNALRFVASRGFAAVTQ
jgi:thiamine biosynthesis lipoprotein